MKSLLPEIMAQLVPVAITVITALASAGMVYLNRWLKAKAGAESVAVVNEVAGTVVAELGATLAKEFKAAAADGKLTKDEAFQIKDMALARIKQQIPNAVCKAATRAVGDLETFLSGKIEEKVNVGKEKGK